MKIIIDTRWVFEEISGVGSHTLELVKQLIEIDKNNQYILLFSEQDLLQRTESELGLTAYDHVSTEQVEASLFSIRNQLAMPAWLRKQGCDLFHSTNYMIPLRAFPSTGPHAIACVTTIHDVIPFVFPDHAPKAKKTRLFPLYRWLMNQVARRSDAIITVSQASRKDILKHLDIPATQADKVTVIYNGVSKRFTQPPKASKPADTANRERTILYVGRFDPYKNVVGLVHALAAARERCPFPVRLLIAGAPDPRYPEAETLARELGVDSAITWSGYLAPDQLLQAYQQADVLMHPSRYEGFGLQILEAMASGLPVISSNAASLPEVAGEAAILLDPDDSNGFAENIHKILTDEPFAASLRQKGTEQAARFTWRATAEQTLALYERIHANLS